MQKVFLARHGETDWNREMRFQGRENIPLNDNGKNQARLLSRRLRKEKLFGVFSSPLIRAHETAEIIASAHGLTPRPLDGLGEIYFGSLEGKTYNEITDKEQNAVDQWMVSPETGIIPGGENFINFRKRIQGSFQELLGLVEYDKDFVIVTHAGAIKVLVADILGMPLTKFARLRLSPSSITTFLYDNWRNVYLDSFNDICHLAIEQF